MRKFLILLVLGCFAVSMLPAATASAGVNGKKHHHRHHHHRHAHPVTK